jgi:histidinol dehydrogenase
MSAERQAYALAVLSGMNGGIVLAKNDQQSYDFINEYAPEHCQILSREADKHLPHIQTASEILLGEYAAGSLANYMMGPNCVLPTSGAAHAHAPLGVHDFMRTASIGRVDAIGFAEMAPKTEVFARYEGFDAHANAVSDLRLPLIKGDNNK